MNGGGLGAFVLRSGGLFFESLGALEQLSDALQEVCFWLDGRLYGTDGKAPLRRIGDVLVRPLGEQGLLDGLRGVYLVPSSVLTHLPLHAVFGQGKGCVLEDVEVAY